MDISIINDEGQEQVVEANEIHAGQRILHIKALVMNQKTLDQIETIEDHTKVTRFLGWVSPNGLDLFIGAIIKPITTETTQTRLVKIRRIDLWSMFVPQGDSPDAVKEREDIMAEADASDLGWAMYVNQKLIDPWKHALPQIFVK